jgi:DNA-binding beta-propeller fold protein YncE
MLIFERGRPGVNRKSREPEDIMRADLNTQYAGSNITGDTGLIAIDKIGNKVRFYDPRDLREIKALDAPEKTVHELTFSADRKYAFAPLYGDGIYGSNKEPNNKVLIIDLERQALGDMIDLGACLAPHGMVGTRDGKLWVVSDLVNKLLLVDPAAKRIETTYDIPGKGSHFCVLLPDESKLYVSNKEADVGVFDLSRHAFLPGIPLGRAGVAKGNGSGSEGLTPTPDGKRLLVIDNDRSDIRVIDTVSDREIDRVALVMHPPTNVKRSRLCKLMFAPDGRTLVVVSYATGLAWVIDAADYRRQTPIAVAKGPFGIAFAPDSRTALIASHDSGLITRIDLAARAAIEAYDGGNGIECLAYY